MNAKTKLTVIAYCGICDGFKINAQILEKVHSCVEKKRFFRKVNCGLVENMNIVKL